MLWYGFSFLHLDTQADQRAKNNGDRDKGPTGGGLTGKQQSGATTGRRLV
jgi:hypothetical protein